MTPSWPGSLVLAGAGKMGGAMLRGWLARGLPAETARIIDPYLSEPAAAEWRAQGVELNASEPPAVLVLAIKPQGFAEATAQFAQLVGPETMIVSILAGKTLASLRSGLPNAATIVRTMPNLPASIGQGATGAAAEPSLTDDQRAVAQTLLGAIGHVEWLDERFIDAVTAVSGSGPAYLFYVTECLAEAGAAAGLDRDVAARLARATIQGAAALMAAEPDRSPAALREAVTSPGGTTAAALAVLQEEQAMAKLMRKAVEAARRRSAELAG